MAKWVKETVRHILLKGTNKLCSNQNLLYGVADIQRIKEGQDEFTFIDNDDHFTLHRYVTNDSRFYAYMGITHLLVRPGKYYSCLAMVIYDITSDSFVQIKVDNTRNMIRFRTCMYTNTKVLVFKELYNHFYMIDVNFNDIF